MNLRQQRLRHFRRRLSLGLTQKQLGEHAGVSNQTVYKYETGHSISEKSLKKITRVLYMSNTSTPGTVSVWDNNKGKTVTIRRGF